MNTSQSQRNFHELVAAQWKNGKFLCVGLDPVNDTLPPHIQHIEDVQQRLVAWATDLIRATAPYAAAFKPNTAFFEAYGQQGIAALEEICEVLRTLAPEAVIILDAKRGDIESTNKGTAAFAFDVCGADAITLQPYVGGSALEPFLNRAEKGAIVLCRTSNASAPEFQNAMVITPAGHSVSLNTELYRRVAETVTNEWNSTYSQDCWLVVGATAPAECAELRAAYPHVPFLIPGVGAQGGDLAASVHAARRADGAGFLISVSRAIIYAGTGDDYAQVAGKAAEDYHAQITEALSTN